MANGGRITNIRDSRGHSDDRSRLVGYIDELEQRGLVPGDRDPNEQRRPEADGDLHLVISDGTHTMIAEAPAATCNTGATTYRRNQMKNARAAAKVCNTAQLTGVAFFDFFHHQTGVAPNEIELHPLLAFKCVA
jgi:hypothetical protein